VAGPPPDHCGGKNALALDFALRAIAAQPGGYLADVVHDAALSFTWDIANHPSALMTRRYEFAYATEHWIAPGYVLVPGHTVASDQVAYGGATSTGAVEPFAGWLCAYQRVAYLRGTLLALVLLTGLGGIARAGGRAQSGSGGGRGAGAGQAERGGGRSSAWGREKQRAAAAGTRWDCAGPGCCRGSPPSACSSSR
jgi:hypothetical protein